MDLLNKACGVERFKYYDRYYLCMKQLNITFENEEHKKLVRKKEESGLNWHDFILKLIEEKNENI